MTIIDVWAQVPTTRFMAEPWLESLLRWTGEEGERKPVSVAQTLAEMDRAKVDAAILSAWHGPQGVLISNDEVEAAIDVAPARLHGLVSVDLNRPMEAVREIRARIDNKKFIGVRIIPWLWGLPPNDRRYYPIYAACVDAGVPFCTQIGHTGPLLSSETGRLIPYLEEVMIDFPELKVVGGHVGFPWLGEVVSMTHKFPNFYVDTSAYALHRLPPDFVAFMKGVGRDRVMFGTNWPMLSASRCLERLDGLGLSDEGKDAFLSGNAKRVFGI